MHRVWQAEPVAERVLTGLSSMATRDLLADLAAELAQRSGVVVRFTSAGGVEVAERVRAGAVADLLVLADGAMQTLEADGLLVPETMRPLFGSDVVAAVPGAAPELALATEEDLRAALIAASRIAYSTGPSGASLLKMLARWDLTDQLVGRLVQASPGVPVGSLLASGDADLGFQQRSELTGAAGVRVLGPLPGSAAIRSTFTGGVLTTAPDPDLAREVLALLGAPALADTIRRRGMLPAD